MTVREHWPQWYKDLYNADTERKRSRLAEQNYEAHRLGLFDNLKLNAAFKRAETLNDLEVSAAVIKMHKFLRGR